MQNKNTCGTLALVALLSACTSVPEHIERSPYTMKSDGVMPDAQKGLTVKHADLSFKILPETQSIEGTSALTLFTEYARDMVSVDLDPLLRVSKVTLNGELVAPAQYSNPQGELVVNLPQSINGEFTLAVSYAGKPRIAKKAPWDGGFVWSKTADGQDWIATAVQGEGCDLFWACIDHPQGEPQSLNMHISVPAGLVAAANGVLQKTTEQGQFTTYHWHSDMPQNTYGVALNIAPYEVIKEVHPSIFGNNIDIHYYHLPETREQAKGLVSEMHQILDFFERTIGPYPFAKDKMGVAETPHLGMEHQSINAYGNEYRADPYGFDWLLHHEFAHEWFANQLTNKDADDMWLHEGFGAYLQPLYAQQLHGDMAYHSYLYKQRLGIKNLFPLVSHQEMAVEEVYQEEKGPGGDIYGKGSLILHSLRQLIGDEAFFKAVRILVYGTENPQPGEFQPLLRNSDDFVKIVNNVTGKDLSWFFEVYLFQAKLPKLLKEKQQDTLTLQWQTEKQTAFPMPLDVSINGKVTTLDMSVPQSVKVKDSDIVIIDPHSKILKDESYIQRYQQYMEAKFSH